MKIASELATQLQPGDIIFLKGDLAAGKTVFARGLVRGLGGVESEVDSPTFVILQSYECPGKIRRVHHLDLYRLREESLESIGLEEILAEEGAITIVEWPDDRILALKGRRQRLIRVEIEDRGGLERSIRVEIDS